MYLSVWAHVEFSLTGVQHLAEVEAKRPTSDTYIHKIISETGQETRMHIVFTLVPALAARVHNADYTVHDFTYKRVWGDWKEWEVVIWDNRLSKRASDASVYFPFSTSSLTKCYDYLGVTVARIYCTRETRLAFATMFRELWKLIEKVTGKPMRFKFLHGSGLKAILVDGDKRQVEGCGDDLVLRAQAADSLIKEDDPLKIVEYIVKTCDIHLER
jgi:hypothetical protein